MKLKIIFLRQKQNIEKRFIFHCENARENKSFFNRFFLMKKLHNLLYHNQT